MDATLHTSITSTTFAVAERRAELVRAASQWRRKNRRIASASPPTPLVHRVRRRRQLDPSELGTAA